MIANCIIGHYRGKSAKFNKFKLYWIKFYYSNTAFALSLICFVLLMVPIFILLNSSINLHYNKKFYDNGKFTEYNRLVDFENHPLWNIDCKQVISEAESFNFNYFDKNGNINTKEVYFILPKERNHLKPIDINKMRASFLEKCENYKEEVLR